jgi:hypothetical protein
MDQKFKQVVLLQYEFIAPKARPFYRKNHFMGDAMSAAERLTEVILDALQRRGFSPSESEQIVRRLVGAGDALDYLPGRHGGTAVMPFGKYRGTYIEDVPTDYLSWLLAQDWFRVKFPGVHRDVADLLTVAA